MAVAGVAFVIGLVIVTLFITGRDTNVPVSLEEAQGEWVAQASGTTFDLVDVTFVDSSYGWAVGDKGTVVHTSDGGVTWEIQDSGTTIELLRVSFVDRDRGWAVGKFGLLIHTSDGGSTWGIQAEGLSLGRNLAAVSFVNARTGWVITENGSILLRTDDGGATWSRQFFPAVDSRSDMVFIDPQRGWVFLAGGTVIQTTDGGANWDRLSGPNAGTTSGFFLDERNGWLSGFRQRDPGLQFTQSSFDGVVSRTSDGGKTWVRHETGTGRTIWDVAFLDIQEGWSVGSNGLILYSNDGGVEWTIHPTGTEATLRGLKFVDAQNGWAVGDAGTILKFIPRAS